MKTLSDKRKELKDNISKELSPYVVDFVFRKIEEQDKQFIKDLKDKVYLMDYEEGLFCTEERELLFKEIDKLAGDELIKEQKEQ